MVTRDKGLTHKQEINYDVELEEIDALNQIDELNQINKAVDRQPPVDATEVPEVQKDVRSNAGDEIENEFKTDGTRMAQDGKIMPKPGLRKNKLAAKYRTNFRYLGIVN